jgi:hypothetical protein
MLGPLSLMIMLVPESSVGYIPPSDSKLIFQGEDGIGGYSDTHQYICTSFAFWNGKDKILKERLFGVTGHQGVLLNLTL